MVIRPAKQCSALVFDERHGVRRCSLNTGWYPWMSCQPGEEPHCPAHEWARVNPAVWHSPHLPLRPITVLAAVADFLSEHPRWNFVGRYQGKILPI